MKTLLSMIGIGIVAVMFAACADLSPADDPPGDESLNADLSATDTPVIPAGSEEVAADAVEPGAVCHGFTIFGGGSCPSGYTCLWRVSQFRGQIVASPRGCVIPNLRNVPCPSCSGGTFNDEMSSWSNRSGAQSCWWFDAGPSGTRIVMPNGVAHNSTSPANNDQASAFGTCR
jgi:hypothetical protein